MLITICDYLLITVSDWPLQRNERVLCVHLWAKFKPLSKSPLEGTRTQAKRECSDCFAKASFCIHVCEYSPRLHHDLVLGYPSWTKGVLQNLTSDQDQTDGKEVAISQRELEKPCWLRTLVPQQSVLKHHWLKWEFRILMFDLLMQTEYITTFMS